MTADAKQRTILVTGANGQVGFELVRSLQGLGQVMALDRRAFDLRNPDQMRRVVRELRPGLIINAAAYTAVDQAESDQANAMFINAQAPGILAEEAKQLDAVLVHYSTDYVFDGTKDGSYIEDDATNPQNVYGVSKLAGERAIAEVGGAHLVFRTSWVYGRRGKNFFLTMLKLAAERKELRIVCDQFGAPTWSRTIATSTAHIVAKGLEAEVGDAHWWRQRTGTYNLSAAGSTSWAGFADAIFGLAELQAKPKIIPISAMEYPVPAKRPSNSRLSNAKLAQMFDVCSPDWRTALALCMEAT